jgi:molybdopterin/thiamine biosynthesis adenylyltransferase/molybdopterin synthase catalytic subunit/rhodanese-related sulfurtransferase
MFALTEQPIDAGALRARLQRPEAGALVVFEGWVRNHHGGRAVTRLEYEAFAEMAQSEGEALLAEVERDFPGVQIVCMHRCGDLAPGDIAVWIGATSAHRDDAFRAARLMIEEVKRRLPVWKKEHYPGAAPVWVNCTLDTGGAQDGTEFSSRQTALPEVGEAGRQRLANASVLVVGMGGLGCPAALYLAGAGVGRLTLADGGRLERSNLHRQVLFETGDIGAPKASRAALALRARNPHIAVEALATDVTGTNARALVTGRTVVLDCTDNFTTRLLLHDLCLELGVPLVQAAVHRWEGVLNVFRPETGGCLYCTGLPRRPHDLDTSGNCTGAPVFGPAVGLLGVWQAAEAIKVILDRPVEETLAHHTLLVDTLGAGTTRLERPARSDCPYCRARRPAPAATHGESRSLWIERSELARLDAPRLVLLVTTEERQNFEAPAEAQVLDPADTPALNRLADEAAGALVLACPFGLRSAAVARGLRADGRHDVFALAGGLPRASAKEPTA